MAAYSGTQSSLIDNIAALVGKGSLPSSSLAGAISPDRSVSGARGTSAYNPGIEEKMASSLYNSSATSYSPGSIYGNGSSGSGSLMSSNPNREMFDSIVSQGAAQRRVGKAQKQQDIQLGAQEARTQGNIALELQRKALEDRLSMIRGLLGQGGFGQESTMTDGSESESGGEYQMIGGRPVWMPTSRSKSSRQKETKSGIALDQLLAMILGG